ncbi:hypothetical protein [Pseudobacteriovorax antillogorgiicola]|uniref:Uncharacterized protein n=1 Tax=Pseudobacteriovorax antillogorgiicola TaxID=1513793 RepID=A0A1Y6BXY1_9BACT|nr:hypothetical protein [Pseudobacteriovorax antillogorgiicola]TCS53122.1 hypothetical protein EDD56_108173 [Pseudobacteriovorax antillogorgiicola]SMF25468.1 hypothetical protein SAMN06296036_10873 [Pseudobacteriovorax antillogorgiicola]
MSNPELDYDYQIPQEKSGRIPILFVLFLGLLGGWAGTYMFYNLGSFASVHDNIDIFEFCNVKEVDS